MTTNFVRLWLALAAFWFFASGAPNQAQELPDWAGKIRADHPRLFFNRDTWGAVRERALGAEKAWYDSVKGRVDRLRREMDGPASEVRDLGSESAWAAFVYLLTGDRQYLDLAKKTQETSLRFYEKCYEEKK